MMIKESGLRKRAGLFVAAAVVGTMAATSGCAGGGDSGGGSTGAGRVEIIGGPSGESGEALKAEIAKIAEETGIDVTYTPVTDFDTVIFAMVTSGNAPDIALFPQPGVLRELASRGFGVPLDDLVDVEAISAQMVPGLADSGMAADGTTLGLPVSVSAKSIVWYPKAAFETAGYDVPTTHQELVALTEQIKADGHTPWCFGIESGAGTGWPATDWIEEYVLRIGGPEVYDQWVTHEIPFDDPVVIEAGEAMEELLLAEGNTVGGRQGITATNFGESARPLAEDPPGCFLHRQGNWISAFWPEEVQADLQSQMGAFLLPPYEGGWDGGQAVVGGGDLAAAFTDSDAVKTVLAAMLSPEFGVEWAKSGQFLSPFTEFDASAYIDPTTADVADYIATADAFRFDGSDQMPGQVGSGTFWSEMVAWIAGSQDLETALGSIDASWPAED